MPPDENTSIASRALSGSFYSFSASAVTLTLGLIRSILLLKLLLPEDFGVATQALFFLNLAAQFRLPGMDSGLIHRQEVDGPVLPTYFTMRMGLLLLTLVVTAAFTPLLARFYPDMPLLRPVLLAFLLIDVLKGLNGVQETVLNRRLAFRRISLANVASSAVMTVVAPYLAWQGWGVWSLVGEYLSGQSARLLVYWLVARPWQPRFGWDRQVVRWFWNFGLKVWSTMNLSFALDRFDDFWIGTTLGKTPLGYYSRAYEFAGYPRRVVGNPLVAVFFPTFARLQGDRLRLSRAFFRATSVMVRAGFWFSLVLILAAPEIITLLGEQWRPMQTTFQLMIVYTLLDPLAMTALNLLIAIGYPQFGIRTQLVQALVFIPGVVLLSRWLGIAGVALAADLMMLAGTALLFAYAHRFVDYSTRRLWLWPGVALIVTAAAVIALNPFWSGLDPWLALLAKAAFITILYGGLLWLTEREQILSGWQMLWRFIVARLPASPADLVE